LLQQGDLFEFCTATLI